MTCETTLSRLNAWLDEELPASEKQEVTEHLESCPSCHANAEELKSLHSQLQSHFAPFRKSVPDLVTAVLNAPVRSMQAPPLPKQISPGTKPWRSALLAFSAAAAGYLLAFVLLPRSEGIRRTGFPEQVQSQNAPDADIVLTVASGLVEVQRDGKWQAMPTGTALACGVPLRTGKQSRCELRTPDGSEIRLNHGTEVNFITPRRVVLASGQVWSTVAPAKEQFQLVATVATITALGTQFDVKQTPAQTVLSVLEGNTRITAAGQSREVSSGHRIIFNGKALSLPEQRQDFELFQATNWVHEILMLKGRHHPELARRINDIFASIGQTKMEFLVESEIRTLGDHAVVPLTQYLQSPRSFPEEYKRQRAAKLLADLAQPGSIGELLPLLKDRDSTVRGIIALGLKRLTGQDLGFNAELWRTGNAKMRARMYQAWEKWWLSNQDRFRLPSKDI